MISIKYNDLNNSYKVYQKNKCIGNINLIPYKNTHLWVYDGILTNENKIDIHEFILDLNYPEIKHLETYL